MRQERVVDCTRALLFIHGLGDSGLTWEPLLAQPGLQDSTLIAPDLIGYGRSSSVSSEKGYSFAAQIERLWRILDHFRVEDVVLIGHSMGGDIANLMADGDQDGRIKGLINVEGALTQHDLFLSGKAAQAATEGCFNDWWREFIAEKAWDWGEVPSGREYYASLRFCRREAFLEGAQEIVRWATKLNPPFQSRIGEIFSELTIHKLFCYGSLSLPPETLEFVKQRNLPAQCFEGVGHCPHYDQTIEFVEVVADFLKTLDYNI
ncbi:MAG: alpha/beta hydrolase [bacterium]